MGFMKRRELLIGQREVVTMSNNVSRITKVRSAARRLELWGFEVKQIGRSLENWIVEGECCNAERLVYLAETE